MGGVNKARGRFAFVLAAAALLGLGALAMPVSAHADGTEQAMTAAELQKAKGVTQEIQLGDGSYKLELRKGYAFAPAGDAPAILQKLGVTPPSSTILGAVTSSGAKPGAKDYWISVITVDSIGHVGETGADQIGSMAFLDSVKAARPADPALEAFAVAPSYDKSTNKLVWAEQYRANGAPDLRHEQRLLGREAVLGVTTYASSGALKKIQKAAGEVMAMLSFSPGKAYGDFVAGDRRSEYDLPGLITGKRKAGPLVEAAGEGGAPASGANALTLASFAPGGAFQWAPWLVGGIVVLGGAFLTISALRKRGSSDANLTPLDGDGNAV